MTEDEGSQEIAIILIHGSWLGGWCWRPLIPYFERTDLRVFAPTLRGVGGDGGAPTRGVGLGDHVAQIERLIDEIEVNKVILVGHSYGAMVATEVAARCAARIEALYVLDGFIAVAGQSVFDLHPELEAMLRPLIDAGDPDSIQPPPVDWLLAAGEKAPGLAEKLRPMPVRTHYEEPLHSAEQLTCPITYIRFSRFAAFAQAHCKAAQVGWQTVEIDAGHLAIMTAPAAVAQAVLAHLPATERRNGD